MDKNIRKIVDRMLFDYPKINGYIKDRLEEIKYPFIDKRDENVGGGKSNIITIPTENLVITIDDDKRLNALKKQRAAITKALERLDPEVSKVVNRYYFRNEARYKTMRGIVLEYHLSKSAFYRELENFYIDILQELNIYHHLVA